MVNVKLLSGDVIEVQEGTPAFEVAQKISMGLFRQAAAIKIDGKLEDLRYIINNDVTLEILKFEDEGGKHAYWHTASHVLAQAVMRLYPDAKLAIGPAIKNGFYYDIDLDEPLNDEDLPKIEEEMKKIIKEKLEIKRFTEGASSAIKKMNAQGDLYKAELAQEHADAGEDLSFYSQGDFTDLCAGPHLMNTGDIGAVKLTHTAGAYWRGDSSNKMLSRIYGIAAPKQKFITDYLEYLEEARKRDHRKLGKELEIFALYDVGPGLPFFLPKGMVLKNVLLDFWRKEHEKAGYDEISTPILLNQQLWETSGHWGHYRENMYITEIENAKFAIKPMNCPGALLVYNSKMRSYRDLPIRLAELGIVHRHEASGTLNGLKRVREFTQDDSHIFMLPEQIEEEVGGVINLIDIFYKTFGFKYHIELSTRPENSMGTDEEWEMATDGLRRAMDSLGLPYIINEGDGAFYGPKLDFHLEDNIGSTWQCGTIQLDFQQPQRFESFYIGEDGEKHIPIVIHRVILGSVERFIGILIEHYAGAFPAWLAPVQVRILPISEKVDTYSKEVLAELKAAGIRAELDSRNEKIGYKIREAQMEKIPYFFILGENEDRDKTVSIRERNSDQTKTMDIKDFIQNIKEEISEKRQ